MPSFKMVAFDVGDTLCRTGHPRLLWDCYAAEQRLLLDCGFSFTQDEYLRAAERAWRVSQNPEYKNDSLATPKLVLQFLNIKPDKRLVQKMSETFSETVKRGKYSEKRVMEGALETIHSLHDHGIELGIVSDTRTSWVRDWLKELKVSDFFSIIVLSNELGGKKASMIPFRHFIKEVQEKFSFNPEEIVVVGDYSVDMDAKKAGMATILFNPSGSDFSYFECLPDFVIKDLREILGIVL